LWRAVEKEPPAAKSILTHFWAENRRHAISAELGYGYIV